MRRAVLGLLGLLALAAPAPAHFPWVIPSADGKTVKVVFSDTLAPDKNVSITKLDALKLYAWGAKDRDGVQLARVVNKDEGYLFTHVPAGKPFVGGVCHYGVVAKGKADPFLLVYHVQAIADAHPSPIPPSFPVVKGQALRIDPLPTRGAGKPHVAGFTVLFNGKPLPDAEVAVLAPGADKDAEGKTDKDGFFSYHVDHVKQPGLYGVRARHVLMKAGKEGDKEYKEIRHNATLVFRAAPAQGKGDDGDKKAKLQPSPAATKLLADARAARANWRNFPGFTADLAVNVDGKVHKGTVEVSDSGKVKLTLADEPVQKWALRQLQSLVNHRLDDSAGLQTPCAFADDDTHHPLGRKIRVLNDELHSSYRIRDRQVIEVNRHTGPSRFTIIVLENRVNAEKQFLPSCYVVNTWDNKTGALLNAQAFHQTWVRVGSFDLPARETIVNAGGSGLGARTITLTHHKLLSAAAQR